MIGDINLRALLLVISIGQSLHVTASELSPVGNVGDIWSGYENEQVLFEFIGTKINPASCGSTQFYLVDETKADSNKFLSMLLIAQSRGADIQVRISETDCVLGYPVALRMAIKS